MMYGILLVVAWALVFAPAVLIAFSRLSSGAVKVRWVLYALIPWLAQQGSILLIRQLRSIELAQFFTAISPGFLVWFFAWLIYFAYRHKFHPDAKSVEGFRPKVTLAVTFLAIGLVLARWGAWALREKPILLPWILFYGFGIALLIAVVKWNQNLAFRMLAVVLVLFASHHLAWFDNALAEREFAKLCKEQAGTRIYRTVELGQEYFTPEGLLIFLNAEGDIEKSKLPSEYEFLTLLAEPVKEARWSKARRSTFQLRRAASHDVLGEFVSLSGQRGGPPGTNVEYRPIRTGSCPKHFLRNHGELLTQVFKKHK